MKDILGLLALSWGLVLLVLIGIAFLVVVPLAVWYAKKHGRSKWRWGIGAFLVIYLTIFWDWIPTVVVHKYYCEKEAGFWVYKTLDQWKAENPGVMEGLVSYNRNPGGFNVDWPSQHEQGEGGHKKININHINERFNVSVSQQDISDIFPIIRKENVLFDVKRNFVVARYIDFGTGNSVFGSPVLLKFWLHNNSCIGGKERQIRFGKFYIQFKGAEK